MCVCVCVCVCVKFCCKLGKNVIETFQLFNQAHGEDCMSWTQCCEWFKRFKEGTMSVDEDPRPERTSTSTNDDHVERVHATIRGNHHLTVREVAEEVGISIGSCHQIFYWKTSDASYQCKIHAMFVDWWSERELCWNQSGTACQCK